MHISTVRIRSVETASGFIVINEADFDPSKHQLWNSEVTTAGALLRRAERKQAS